MSCVSFICCDVRRGCIRKENEVKTKRLRFKLSAAKTLLIACFNGCSSKTYPSANDWATPFPIVIFW